MKNLRARLLRGSRQIIDSTPCFSSSVLADVDGQSILFFVTESQESPKRRFELRNRNVGYLQTGSSISWENAEVFTGIDDDSCAGLAFLEWGSSQLCILAMRKGALVEVDVQTGFNSVVGEFVDEDLDRSGILAISASPDCSVLVVVSPVKVTLLTEDWSTVAEVPLESVVASASVQWRGDGKYFVVHVRDKSGDNFAYVVSEDAAQIDQVELGDLEVVNNALAWQPRAGGLISMVCSGGNVTFFERNGLRHLRSDFCVRDAETRPIREMKWSSDSEKLAIAQDSHGSATVDVYIRSNFKWYRKNRFQLQDECRAIRWDLDDPNTMYILTKQSDILSVQLRYYSGHVLLNSCPHSAVVDGNRILLTNLASAIIPPPMCHGTIDLHDPVQELCSESNGRSLGALLCNGMFAKVELSSMLRDAPIDFNYNVIPEDLARVQKWDLRLDASSDCDGIVYYRTPLLLGEDKVIILKDTVSNSVSNETGDELCLLEIRNENKSASVLSSLRLPYRVVTMTIDPSSMKKVLGITDSGTLFVMNVGSSGSDCFAILKEIAHSSFARAVEIKTFAKSEGRLTHCFVLCGTGELMIVDLSTSKICTLSKECSSFTFFEQFLVHTTRNHVLFCIPLTKRSSIEDSSKGSLFSLIDMLEGPTTFLPEAYGALRPIDRGSTIITSLPNDVRLILQAPRGNIETIAPRPVVLARVRQLVRDEEYGDAFALCRRQRIDMNKIVNVNIEAFVSNAPRFISLVKNPDHLCVFLTGLEGDDAKVNRICDSMIAALKDGGSLLMLPLLTAFVRKRPSEFENALLKIWNVHENDGSKTNSYIDYLFVLCKNDGTLYEHALGTYNLALTVLVAKCSKVLDPAEYGPEVKNLRAMGEDEMKFTIDTKLKRNYRALRSLYRMDEQASVNSHTEANGGGNEGKKFEKSLKFALDNSLFETALELFVGYKEIMKVVREAHGLNLMKQEKYIHAASVFVENEDLYNAAKAYDLGGYWQLALGAIARCNAEEHSKNEFYSGLALHLQENGNSIQAAQIYRYHLQDLALSVEVLLRSEHWSDAIEVASSISADEELWKTVREAVAEGGKSLASDLKDCSTKVLERGKRLVVVRETKRLLKERLGTREVEGVASELGSNTSASSFASNVSDLTFVGRSAATSVYSSTSGVSGPVDRKKERSEKRRMLKSKKKRVKEGHPHEEEYLIQYLKKLIPGNFLRDRVHRMVDSLLFFSFQKLAEECVVNLDDLAQVSLKLPEGVLTSDEATMMQREEWKSWVHAT